MSGGAGETGEAIPDFLWWTWSDELCRETGGACCVIGIPNDVMSAPFEGMPARPKKTPQGRAPAPAPAPSEVQDA